MEEQRAMAEMILEEAGFTAECAHGYQIIEGGDEELRQAYILSNKYAETKDDRRALREAIKLAATDACQECPSGESICRNFDAED